MRNSTYFDTILEEAAPPEVSTCSDTPTVNTRPGTAGNDASCEDAAVTRDQIEPRAQPALATSGIEAVATTDTAPWAWPTSDQLDEARAHRALILGDTIVAAIRAVGTIVRLAHARHRQRQEAGAIRAILHQLDDHMLHDLGIDRSEIGSVAAEVTGLANRTRLRVLLMPQRFPK